MQAPSLDAVTCLTVSAVQLSTQPPNPLPNDESIQAPEAPTFDFSAQPMPAQAPKDPPWSIGDVLLLAALSFVAVFILQAIALVIGTRLHPHMPVLDVAKNARYLVPPQLIAYLLIFAYMVALVRARGVPFWRGIRWDWPKSWILFLLGGLGVALFTQVVGSRLPMPKDTPFQQYFSDTTSAYLMAVMAVFFAPFMEEMFFRGFMFPVLARKLGTIASIFITAICFTLIHAQQLAVSWAPLLLIFIVGITLTLVRYRTGSVASSFLVHFGYNFSLLAVAFFASDHFRHFEKIP